MAASSPGLIVDLSPTSLTISNHGTRSFAAVDVSSIRRTDGLLNGILIGAGVGGAVAVIGISGAQESGSEGGFYTWLAIGSWLFPAVGAVTGAFVDRSIGNRTVYARSGPPRMSLSVGPLMSAGRSGVVVSLRF